MASKTRRIYIVEDDSAITAIVTMALEMEGFEVKSASNGIDALKLIREQSLPDLILLDMRMPELDGWGFASEFRAKYGSAVPIVVMTAAGDVERRAMDVEATAWLGKPFTLKQLQDVIHAYMS